MRVSQRAVLKKGLVDGGGKGLMFLGGATRDPGGRAFLRAVLREAMVVAIRDLLATRNGRPPVV